VMIKLKVCLADDQPVVRAGLRALLDARDDMEVVGEASDGRRAVDALLELRPDVSVLDLSMPEMGGAEAAAKIHAACPEVKVLALTVHEDEAYIRQMLAAGASGYVLKRGAAEELIQAVRAVSAGGIYLDPSLSGKVAGLVRRPVGPARPAAVELSAREAESFRLISRASRIKKSPRSSSGTPRRSRRTRPGRWKSSGCLAGLRSSSMPSAAVG